MFTALRSLPLDNRSLSLCRSLSLLCSSFPSVKPLRVPLPQDLYSIISTIRSLILCSLTPCLKKTPKRRPKGEKQTDSINLHNPLPTHTHTHTLSPPAQHHHVFTPSKTYSRGQTSCSAGKGRRHCYTVSLCFTF